MPGAPSRRCGLPRLGPVPPASPILTVRGAPDRVPLSGDLPFRSLSALQASAAGTFPLSLSVSSNGHYLQDAKGQPFLIKEAGAWGLIQALSLANAKDFIDKRVAQGFNAMKVSVISADTRFPGSPPNWNGNPPFTTAGNFSTASGATAYWNHVDDVLDYMLSKGVLAFLVPAYLGYAGDASQGWATTMNADSDANLATYGTFLGNRFKNRSNIIWCGGGDQVPGAGAGASVILSRYTSMVNAIRAVDSHLWTDHWAGDYQIGGGTQDPVAGGMLSTDLASLASQVGVNGLYSYNPSVQVYTRIRTGYNLSSPVLPVFPLDQSYETDGGTDNQPQGTPLEIRTKAHRAMCEGACGGSFTCGSNWYLWVDWTTVTQGQNENVYWKNLWESMPWQSMAPDQSNVFVTAGRNTYGAANYVCVLASSSGYLVAHCPSGAGVVITIDMSQFSRSVTARWYDPTNGTYTAINGGSPISNSGTPTFGGTGATYPFPAGNNSAGDSDWLLVFT